MNLDYLEDSTFWDWEGDVYVCYSSCNILNDEQWIILSPFEQVFDDKHYGSHIADRTTNMLPFDYDLILDYYAWK